MCTNYEQGSLSELLRTAKAASSGSVERRDVVREILRSKKLRAELFQLATKKSQDKRQICLSRKIRNEIIWLMQESDSISFGISVDPEIYQEALARTWEWFGKNFESYQPERASFVTWFNMKLRFMVIDVQYEVAEERKKRQLPFSDEETGTTVDPINLISDMRQDTELSAEFGYLIEQIWNWLQKQKRPLSRKFISRCPQANCYDILSKYLPRRDPESKSWRMGDTFTEIAESLDVSQSDIMRCFRDKCWPELRNFVKSQGLY